MKINRDVKAVTLRGEEGDELTLRYANRGEPYRNGVDLSLHNPDTYSYVGIFLEEREAIQFRDFLNHLYPERKP